MTPEERARLRALCAGATSEPWTSSTEREREYWLIYGPGRLNLFSEPIASSESGSWSTADSTKADIAFVCEARSALPKLLDEVERLEAEIVRLKKDSLENS